MTEKNAEDATTDYISEIAARADSRLEAGYMSYGDQTFFRKMMFEEAYDELADTINYIGFLYTKLRILELRLGKSFSNWEGEINDEVSNNQSDEPTV